MNGSNYGTSGSLRNFVFWLHLTAGLIGGVVLLSMSCSGMLLAFAPQITAWAERDVSLPRNHAGGSPLRPDSVFASATAAFPDARIESLVFTAHPGSAILIGFPKDRGGAFLDPYSGAVLGRTSRLRDYFLAVEHWHRWMGEAKRGEFLTHAAALSLIFLALSGVYLWIPRRKGADALKRSLAPDWSLKGRAGERNMHMTFGIWSGAILLIIGLTGAVMGYRWAESLLYAIAGNGIGSNSGGGRKPPMESEAGSGFSPVALDSLLQGAVERVPGWSTVTLRLPRKSGAPANAMIEEAGWLGFPHRSRLSADPETGAILAWEPYPGQSAGGKWRGWMEPLHTGRGFGILGQTVAALAAFSLGFLVWTGLSLGIRRVAERFVRPRKAVRPALPQSGSRQSVPGIPRNGYRPWKRK